MQTVTGTTRNPQGHQDKDNKSSIWWVLVILLFAAAFRLYGLNNFSPPGLEHDEVANWLINRAILEGQHGIYFTEAYGHEAGFHYLQAASIALLGDHALGLRLPAAFAGLLVVALQYALARRLFGFPVAIAATALLAVLFWPVFYSRLGLRAISLPLVSGLSLLCWWRGWGIREESVNNARAILGSLRGSSIFWLGLSGALAGLTLYTYMAARSVPIFWGLFILYLALFHQRLWRQKWRGLLLFVFLLLAVAAPLVIFLAINPGAEFRISEIDAPLKALMAGDLNPVLANSFKVLGMFGFSGDPLWRQNVAGRPVFEFLLGFLFYGGLLLALWRWRQARFAFLVLWLGISATPSIVTADAPSSIRMINALLVITIFPASVIHIIPSLSTVIPKLPTKTGYLLTAVLALFTLWGTAVALFETWPENEEVKFVWQAALTETAAHLDQSVERGPVAVGGWSPATMDPPTMNLSMRRDDLELRFYGSDSTAVPITTLVIPAAKEGQNIRITRPAIREISSSLETQLTAWKVEKQVINSFVQYQLAYPVLIKPQIPMAEDLNSQLRFLGASLVDEWGDCDPAGCRLLTYWEVLAPADGSRRFFLHALNEMGEIIAQHDGLDAPAVFWKQGDYLVQEHTLPLGSAVPHDLRLGVYDPTTGQRLLRLDGQDFIPLLFP